LKNSEFERDFAYSEPEFFKSAAEEDRKLGIDFWLCGLPVAYRKRRKDYNDITIRYRRKSGAKTEYIKILEGTFKAVIFIFEFPSKVVLCSTKSISEALRNHRFEIIENKDNQTILAVIKLKDLKYSCWEKLKK